MDIRNGINDGIEILNLENRMNPDIYEIVRDLRLDRMDTDIDNLKIAVKDLQKKIKSDVYNQEDPGNKISDSYYLQKAYFKQNKRKGEMGDIKTQQYSVMLGEYIVELANISDMNEQIYSVAKLVSTIRKLLKIIPDYEGNYKRKSLMLLYEALKRNYSKKVFSNQQVAVLTKIVHECQNNIVSKEFYLKMDEELYDCDLDTLPEWE